MKALRAAGAAGKNGPGSPQGGVMRLYHCDGSRSLRCLWTLEEMGLAHELTVLPFPPRAFAKDYKAVNPLGTVPALVDGESTMTESVSICQYLADRYGPTDLSLKPADKDYPLYLNWMGRADATLTFPQTIYFRYTALEPEERRQPQVAEDYRKWFLARWTSVEAGLEGRDYLCGDRFTLADICVGYAFYFSQVLNIGEANSPNVARWWSLISAREGFSRASAERAIG